ncbi:MAG: hypothetical protein ACYC6T_04660 [Thermoleophilia bacterium]
MYSQRSIHPIRRPTGRDRVRRRPLPRDIRRNHFVSHAVWRPRWVVLLGAVVLVVVVVAASFVLSGCGYANRTTSSTGSGGDGDFTYPTGPEDVVFRIEYGGGFAPVEVIFTTLPGLSLYGDGRVITEGPIPAIYPGPALPNLQVATLSPAGIQKLLAAARDAGLFESGVDYGQPTVADGSTTTFTITADGTVFETSIYHLAPDNSAALGLSDDQVERRARVLDFQTKLGDLAGWFGDDLGPEQPYEWQALSILIMPGDPGGQDDSGIEPRIVDWPLADLATLGEPNEVPQGRRAVITGADLETLRPLVQQADTLTFWRSGGTIYSLLLRPLLPDEIG